MILPRRTVLLGAPAAVLAALPRSAGAEPRKYAAALAAITGGATPRPGLVRLDLPAIIDNGNSVAMTVLVEEPLPPDRRVLALHVLADGNPLPEVIHARFGPRSGRAQFSTRIRLATSQTVAAFATCADGTVWTDSVQVLVTLSACLDDV